MSDIVERLRQAFATGKTMLSDQMLAADEIEQLRLAEEGAKEAYGVIVQSNADLRAEAERLRDLLARAYDDIRRLSESKKHSATP